MSEPEELEEIEVNLRFGALSPPLSEQLQGFEYDEEALDHCQRDMEAITRLRVRQLLTDAQVQSAEKKLVKKIEEAVEKGVR